MKTYMSGPQKLILDDGRQIPPRTEFAGLSEAQERFFLKVGAVGVVEKPLPVMTDKQDKTKKEGAANG